MTSESTVCPNCRTSFNPLNAEKFTHFGCPSCGAFYLDAYDEPRRMLRRFDEMVLMKPVLLPGAEGELAGVKYMVTGIIGKCEQGDADAQWYEYILLAADGSMATLAEFNGHWMLVKPMTEILNAELYTGGISVVEYKGANYRQYHRYYSKLTYTLGSFDWNVLDDGHIDATEFILDTNMLVREQHRAKEAWYQGSYIEPSAVAAAFSLEPNMLPARTGVGVLQPNPYARHRKLLLTVAMVFVVLIGVLQLVLTEIHPASTLLNEQYLTEPDSIGATKIRPIVTQPFHLQYLSAVNVNMRATVSNDWIELTASMVNDATGRVYESSKSLESYNGYDDEGAWSEDNSDKDVVFSSVPPGNYHLNLIPAADGGKYIPVTVRVTHSNWILSNFILMLIVIVSVPAYYYISYRVFEQKRFL